MYCMGRSWIDFTHMLLWNGECLCRRVPHPMNQHKFRFVINFYSIILVIISNVILFIIAFNGLTITAIIMIMVIDDMLTIAVTIYIIPTYTYSFLRTCPITLTNSFIYSLTCWLMKRVQDYVNKSLDRFSCISNLPE